MIGRYFISRVALLLLVSVTLAGLGACGGSSGPENREFDLRIENGQLNTNPVIVSQGDMVTLRIQANDAGTFHLHGYDIEVEVGPEQPSELQLVADATGRFPMTFHAVDEAFEGEDGDEAEHDESEAGDHEEAGEVPVGALEVRPR